MDYYINHASEYASDTQFEDIDNNNVRFHNMEFDDMLNGDGLRLTLFLSGCPCHCKDENGKPTHCKECQNPQTWSQNSGIPFTEWEEAEFWDYFEKKPWLSGVTFTGGDPLAPYNRNKVGELARMFKTKYPDKDIWLYSGYTLTEDWRFVDDNDANFEIDWLGLIDVLVDGPFECETRRKDISSNRNINWRGSSNQRVIDIPVSLEQGHIVRKYD